MPMNQETPPSAAADSPRATYQALAEGQICAMHPLDVGKKP